MDTHLEVTVRDGQPVNPVTGTNWEGAGVRRQVADEARLTLAGLG
ncbi:hypothetical protein [Amycolatopsis decaplanina]|uniref:Uncharacterized protein n=1 Tax=Amycolatopsis decaplanina DSM 44594 TaxID=1284240 RepID=M2XG78_9PSEU|nr:hypothetical protein [Amycolatopsis decaplanina]EME59991.1 hypothetical protein H074_13227 [Amycolatopsis decaplanina DSM 44594]